MYSVLGCAASLMVGSRMVLIARLHHGKALKFCFALLAVFSAAALFQATCGWYP